MMRRSTLLNLILSGIAIWLVTGSVQAAEPTRAFLNAIEHYRQGQYQQAAEGFLSISESGLRSGRLYYNLGNAYLKLGRLGHARLWYERALRLIPDDPDLAFNYRYAVSLTKDRQAESGASLWSVLFFWEDVFSAGTIRWLAVGTNLALWSLLLYRTLRKKRPILKAPSYVLMLCLILFSSTAAVHYFQRAHRAEGIILEPKASVRSGFSEQSTELFVLHAGTKVTVERQKDGFYRIKFSEGKIGWLPGAAVGII